MPFLMDYRNLVLEMNGEQVVGLSEDDPPIEFPTIEFLEEHYGKDGALYGMHTLMRGGEFKVKLQPTSPDPGQVDGPGG